MKKEILIGLFSVFIIAFHAQITNPAPYCASSYTSTSIYPEISKVEMATLTNVSTHTPAPGYTYYTNLGATALNLGSSQTIKITFKNVDMETMIKGWIDYNKNNIFESTELIISISQGSVGSGMAVVKQANFSVPLSASTGTVRMRVSLGWHYANWTSMIFKLDSCHTATTSDGSSGETEDYDVNLVGNTGLNEVVKGSEIQLFPNPSSTFVEIADVQLKEKINSYCIINSLGQEMMASSKFPIKVSDLPKDLYFLKLIFKSSEVVYTKLIID